MSLKILYDNVLIKPFSEKEQGGIMLPSNSEKKPTKGEVVAVGKGSRDSNGHFIELTVKAGDKVFYRQWAGTEIEHDNNKFVLMKESDLLAIIE
ncbi:co-chaperone GroES [Wolbachia endosymbiont of Pentidionis agamae]|uniref:co-chaperone GroES n=1 Tax=Wolbachia endosymbiont of Pentidionis agamae TaxID=3110435 RepID=UPI002FD4A42D